LALVVPNKGEVQEEEEAPPPQPPPPPLPQMALLLVLVGGSAVLLVLVFVAAITSEVAAVEPDKLRAVCIAAAAAPLLGVLHCSCGGGDCELEVVAAAAVAPTPILVLLQVRCRESSRGKHSESTKCSVMVSKKPRPPLGLFIKTCEVLLEVFEQGCGGSSGGVCCVASVVANDGSCGIGMDGVATSTGDVVTTMTAAGVVVIVADSPHQDRVQMGGV
jgi:hypothetical protein